MERANRISFESNSGRNFHAELRKRVDDYFKENKLSKHANSGMVAKTVFILTGFAATYALFYTQWFHPAWLLLVAAIHGFFTALIGLNIGHDAIHGSYSKNRRVNKLLGNIFNVIGANDYVWSITHNAIHHTYTNIPGHDDDINQLPIMRMHTKQKLWKIHRFQHIYVFFIYPLASLSWVFIKDYIKFFQNSIGWYKMKKKPRVEFLRLFAYKVVYYSLFLVLPMMFIELPWYQIIFGFLILHAVEGLTLALIFQLAHVVEGAYFPHPDEGGKISLPWADHQMHTTADFARGSKVATFICGGLNFQIEHHLFPNICHCHYTAISPIVKSTAKEYGLPYIENKTFLGAIRSHSRILKTFGRVEKFADYQKVKAPEVRELATA